MQNLNSVKWVSFDTLLTDDFKEHKMKQYTHLTEHERYHIYLMHRNKNSYTTIAKSMNRSISTISREIKRNTGKRGYRYKQAHVLACDRHNNKNKAIKLTTYIKSYIMQKLHQYWSPEQIAGRLWLDKQYSISTETIYRFILQDKAVNGSLYTYLRHQHKRYRKRYGKNDYRGRIPHRTDIDNRPNIVDTRARIGDWEADTVIGKSYKGAILTLLERKSRLYLALPISRKTADEAKAAITQLLQPIKDFVYTITFDNGREFNKHHQVSKTLSCDTYFAKPYQSWQRGANENQNGLLRQFIPKGMKLDKINPKVVAKATILMNNRPRKCLGYKTPIEVFTELTGKNYFLDKSFALMG